jgi:CheY-like chemotaxis protein
VEATSGLRILVVDDNVDAAETLCTILEMWGHEAHVAYNGQEALKLLPTIEPQTALLDIGLPGMNGYELAKAIRALPQSQSVFLVAITGYGDASAREHSLQAGFDHHMTKPVDLEALQALLIANLRPPPESSVSKG